MPLGAGAAVAPGMPFLDGWRRRFCMAADRSGQSTTPLSSTVECGPGHQYAPRGATITLAVRHMIIRSLMTDQFST